MNEHLDWAGDTVDVRDGILKVLRPEEFREKTVEPLIRRAVFHRKPEARDHAIWALHQAAIELGIVPASIHELYKAVGRGDAGGFTVPAFNIRGLTYEICRRIFRAARELRVGAFVLEIARSEMGYTAQSPSEYAASVMAAAIREGFEGPLFLQGDHFQARVIERARLSDREVDALRNLIGEAISAGFYNIDVDASTLVDLDQKTLELQQKHNIEATAYLAKFIRRIEPEEVDVSIGAEIGEVGGRNSTVEELRAFMEGFESRRAAFEIGTAGLSKLSVRVGTVPSGRVLPDGTLGPVKIDYERLGELSQVARDVYKLGGTVLHGASTLPLEAFARLPEHGVIEAHLSTAFQNMMFDAEEFPRHLLEEMNALVVQAFGDDQAPGDTREQFLYRMRKKAWGPFKRELWDLSAGVLDPILDRMEERFATLFRRLGVAGRRDLVDRWVHPTPVRPPEPGPG